ncbi:MULTISPECIES: ABC transporter permease [Nocardia]|uniref:ABC transporter permease n=2 Tax=Nocardia TaxID=1817 RepID=K0F8C7_NOCB7|nr:MULTISPECIES: ABC transporter permease [Nocardia]AFU05947.1 ABC transporter permease [Nocardia brasiliensis ATCC 700358]ASF11147.1 ABC transporter permease [Nocardia brasiliensis]KIA64123.1 ABC transporter permease [Nocardia vulneris]OCF90107.1 ABC transporter permease [Nocardia brasiliensis]SUB10154.1 ABC-2 family transporter protein [Nocardia brasiliensis]
MGVLAAERIKLTSTRSPWWCSAVVVALGLGLAALFSLVVKSSGDEPAQGTPNLDVSTATSGVVGFGVMVLMIMAALTVTSEYRFGVIRTTFQAVPNRTKVLLTKTALVGVFSAVLTTILAFLAVGVAKAIAGSASNADLALDGQWRAVYGIPIYAFLMIAVAIGVGVLVRQSAAAISLIVLWSLLIEPLLGAFGSFGRNVGPFLPFQNASHFLSVSDSGANWHWGPWGSLLYFAAFTAIVYGAALVLVNQRDA